MQGAKFECHDGTQQQCRGAVDHYASGAAQDAKTLPVMVRSQTSSQGINWWSIATMSTGAIAPRVIVGIFLERYIVSGLTTGAGK